LIGGSKSLEEILGFKKDGKSLKINADKVEMCYSN
jgi:hypothetical protein